MANEISAPGKPLRDPARPAWDVERPRRCVGQVVNSSGSGMMVPDGRCIEPELVTHAS